MLSVRPSGSFHIGKCFDLWKMAGLCYADAMDISTDTLALAGLIIALFAWLRMDIKALGQRLDNRIDGLAAEVKTLSDRVSRIEGLLEGLWRPRPWPEQPPEQGADTPRTGTDG